MDEHIKDEYIEIDVRKLGKLTSLKKTIEATQSLKHFFQLKKDIVSHILGFSVSKKQMLRDLGGGYPELSLEAVMFNMKGVFLDLSHLMRRAVEDGGSFLRPEDFKLLEKYLRFNFTECWQDGLTLSRKPGILIIPGAARSHENDIVYAADLSWLNAEVDRRLFTHVHYILMGEEEVYSCMAEDCDRFFVSDSKQQRYCSVRCRNRKGKRNYRLRKKKMG